MTVERRFESVKMWNWKLEKLFDTKLSVTDLEDNK